MFTIFINITEYAIIQKYTILIDIITEICRSADISNWNIFERSVQNYENLHKNCGSRHLVINIILINEVQVCGLPITAGRPL